MSYTPSEMMSAVAARELRDGEVVFVGIGLPNLACNLARATHAPNLVLVYESGAVGATPERMPLSIGDPALVTGALMVCPMADIFQLFLQNGVWNGRAVVPAEWVKASVATAATVPGPAGLQYGYKWWLQPYGASGKRAWAGSGFGGQRPIAVPEHDLVIAVTGWNILPDGPSLPAKLLIDRVVEAIRPAPAPRVQ